MLLLILFVLFYVVLQDKSLKVGTEEIVSSYNLDITASDTKFRNKEITLSGKVKSFFQLEGETSMLQLDTGNSEIQLYCILLNKETVEKAASLTTGTNVKVIGKCLGLNNSPADRFTNSIYIQTEQIK